MVGAVGETVRTVLAEPAHRRVGRRCSRREPGASDEGEPARSSANRRGEVPAPPELPGPRSVRWAARLRGPRRARASAAGRRRPPGRRAAADTGSRVSTATPPRLPRRRDRRVRVGESDSDRIRAGLLPRLIPSGARLVFHVKRTGHGAASATVAEGCGPQAPAESAGDRGAACSIPPLLLGATSGSRRSQQSRAHPWSFGPPRSCPASAVLALRTDIGRGRPTSSASHLHRGGGRRRGGITRRRRRMIRPTGWSPASDRSPRTGGTNRRAAAKSASSTAGLRCPTGRARRVAPLEAQPAAGPVDRPPGEQVHHWASVPIAEEPRSQRAFRGRAGASTGAGRRDPTHVSRGAPRSELSQEERDRPADRATEAARRGGHGRVLVAYSRPGGSTVRSGPRTGPDACGRGRLSRVLHPGVRGLPEASPGRWCPGSGMPPRAGPSAPTSGCRVQRRLVTQGMPLALRRVVVRSGADARQQSSPHRLSDSDPSVEGP